MLTVTDAEGNEIEVPSQEELQTLKAKAEERDKFEATLKEKEEQLAKFSDKEFNFKKFREVEESKREEMMKGFTKREREQALAIDSLNKRLDEGDKKIIEQKKEAVLSEIAGSDTTYRQKVEDMVKDMYPNGLPLDEATQVKAYKRADILLRSEQIVNPMNVYAPVTGDVTPSKKPRFTDTPQGKAIFEDKFGHLIKQAKKINPNLNI